VHYQQPLLLGFFSYDKERELRIGCQSSLNVYHEAILPVDLNSNQENFIQKREQPEQLDAVFETLLYNKKVLVHYLQKRPTIISWRGIMTKLMNAEDSKNDFSLKIVSVNVSLY
ncbi:hypothetical protein ROZALSC1DRAFT_27493, partial [Rozella allomycis CSF55]